MPKINLVRLVAWSSFVHFKIRAYASINFITKGFFIALLLSLFIYLEHFGWSVPLLNTLLYLAGLYWLLNSERESWFWNGFFIGIFWLYWVALSFRFYGFDYLIPLVIVAVALLYGVVFGFFGLFNRYIRALALFFMSAIHPFGCNWVKMELGLLEGYFGVEWWQFGLVLVALVLFSMPKRWLRLIALFPLIAAIDFKSDVVIKDALDIKPVITHLEQDKKWDRRYLNSIIESNFEAIDQAIQEGRDVVVLPESAFPFILNRKSEFTERLKRLSRDIVIVTGSLYYDKSEGFYNSTYYFQEGTMQVAHKVFLVPFGEEVPLPKFLARFINDLFFDGAEDYSTADEPVNVKIKGEEYTNAICFEATKKEMFGHARYMIATSNNAWFSPSIEPTLQNILLRYYAKLYDVKIYHSYNR